MPADVNSTCGRYARLTQSEFEAHRMRIRRQFATRPGQQRALIGARRNGTQTKSDGMELQAEKRSFQFSLTAIFAVVTLLALPCGYLAREASIVNMRARAWDENDSDIERSEAAFRARDILIEREELANRCVRLQTPSAAKPSWLRNALGDVFHDQPRLVLRPANDPRTKRLLELFPETEWFYFSPSSVPDGRGNPSD